MTRPLADPTPEDNRPPKGVKPTHSTATRVAGRGGRTALVVT
jgi:hypothetical protein